MGWTSCLSTLITLPRAILFAILNPGSARDSHVLIVRSCPCALAESKLPATITPLTYVSFYQLSLQERCLPAG
ncbi:hypothetical protein CKQ54_09750 [Rahnella variigena]|uniref:Secreted protein n=1 Tax=Rahnella variigena TaxID=574964 RepID=A0ABX9Q3Q3_9GAMM|nr:hypothetical protein CKQ54_09750 [Rahnella variigena]